jgi:hypothetical protein
VGKGRKNGRSKASFVKFSKSFVLIKEQREVENSKDTEQKLPRLSIKDWLAKRKEQTV